MKDKFTRRKNDVLSKPDKSSKGKWDKRIQKLCDKLNELKDYYSTSSCSGRVVLMIDDEKKGEGLFIKIYHDKIFFKELKKDLEKILQLRQHPRSPPQNRARKTRGIDNKQLIKHKKEYPINNFELLRANLGERGKLIKFKMESCILHVACRDLKYAQKLFDKAKLAGWKNSGIISVKNNVMLELNSTERLEFPVTCRREILVGDKFLKLIVNESNKKLEKSWEKIERLEKALKD